MRTAMTAFATFLLTIAGARADDVATLRIATVAPPGSSFHKRLQALGAEWSRGPGGVSMDIFPGTQGGEPQIVRRLRVGQLQGAMLTSVGLGQIDRGATALQLMPLMFRSWEEVDYVREQLRGELERRLKQAGYVTLMWGDAGWVRFFANTPVRSFHDLRPLKVYASSGDAETVRFMQDYYQPVVLEPDKILLSLRNGLIDAIPIPAFLANFSQVARYAPHMLELRWAPVTGALVVTTRAWDALPEASRAWLQQTSHRAGLEIRAASRAEDDAAIRAMVDKHGLRVIEIDPAIEAEWRAEVADIYPQLRGSVVPADMFDRAVAHLEEYRGRTP